MKKGFKIVLALMLLGTIFALSLACSSGETKVSSGSAAGESSKSADESGLKVDGENQTDLKNLKVGQKVSKDGLSVSVDKISDGGRNYEGKPLIKVRVSYKNEGSSTASFNPYDWSVQDKDGARADTEFPEKGEEMNSGELSPGGTKTGNVYFFKKNADKIVYSGNFWLDAEEDLVMWNVK